MGKEKDFDFFINLIPFLRHMTGQIALGGGEPLMEKGFIKVFSKKCKNEGLITRHSSRFFNLSGKVKNRMATIISMAPKISEISGLFSLKKNIRE